MKLQKYFFSLVVFLLFSVFSFAQIHIGTPLHFCTLSGVQYNPGSHPQGGTPSFQNNWVTTYEETFSESECILVITK